LSVAEQIVRVRATGGKDTILAHVACQSDAVSLELRAGNLVAIALKPGRTLREWVVVRVTDDQGRTGQFMVLGISEQASSSQGESR
jgi:hypothetical protein